MNQNAILLVSFGTSYPQTREKTIDAITADVSRAYPDYRVEIAFTSPTILRILHKRGEEIDDIKTILEKFQKEGVKRVFLQPTHLIPGLEYDKLKEEALRFSDNFELLRVGKPLIASKEDEVELLSILQQEIALQEGEALVLMGHGTLHPANAIYLDMNAACQKAERQRVFVGTVEAKLDISDVLRLVQQNGYRQAALAPMMLVAGDHAIHDMAGDEPDSWKNQFLSAGITPRCVMRGIGEYKAVRALYLRKLEALLD